jgi:hypothetical protein
MVMDMLAEPMRCVVFERNEIDDGGRSRTALRLDLDAQLSDLLLSRLQY